MYSTLIDTAALEQNLENPEWVIVDCRFSLADTGQGRRHYEQSHIPGAVYAHLDHDLSGPVKPGKTGRHPLPDPSALSEVFSAWGIDSRSQVIAYDDSSGMIAARLWWMLRWLGHRRAAVLDGGWVAWMEENRRVDNQPARQQPRSFQALPDPTMLSTAEEVLGQLNQPESRVIDARSPERYSGRQEPIDAVAGRIPGAGNLPHESLLGEDGKFLSPPALKTIFDQQLAGSRPNEAIFYCGSGVSAARDLLAMAVVGLPVGKLYAGSWSHWITDPSRPIERD